MNNVCSREIESLAEVGKRSEKRSQKEFLHNILLILRRLLNETYPTVRLELFKRDIGNIVQNNIYYNIFSVYSHSLCKLCTKWRRFLFFSLFLPSHEDTWAGRKETTRVWYRGEKNVSKNKKTPKLISSTMMHVWRYLEKNSDLSFRPLFSTHRSDAAKSLL